MGEDRTKFYKRLSDFGGGVDLKADDDEMPDKNARIKQNWRNSTAGALEKVSGLSRLAGRVAGEAFGGGGLDDLTSSGTNSAHETFDVKVEIDGVGSPNTYKWSLDDGVTWEATGVAIVSGAVELIYGIKITFAATTGHTSGDDWTFKAYQGLDDAKVTGIHRHSSTKFIGICNGNAYVRDESTGEWSLITGGTTLSVTKRCSFLTYKGVTYFTNTTDGLKKYNGSAISTPSDVPDEACALIKHDNKNRCHAGCETTTETTREFFSALEDFEDYATADDAGWHDVGGRQSAILKAFEAYGNAMLFFKERSAYRVWDFPDTREEGMLGAPGCDAPFSIDQGDGLMFHKAPEGIYMFDGVKFSLISEPIEDIISSIPSTYRGDVLGVYKDHKFYLYFTDGAYAYNYKCWVYDTLSGGWEEEPTRYINCLSHWTGTGDSGELYGGSSQADGVIYRLDYSADGSHDGANLAAKYKSKNHHCDLPNVTKSFDKIFVECLGSVGTLEVRWEIDKGKKKGSFTIPLTVTGGFMLDTDSLDTGVLLDSPPFAVYEKIFPLDAIGRVINFEIYHSDTGESPVINSIEVEGVPIYK